jgi:hypothetical protein
MLRPLAAAVNALRPRHSDPDPAVAVERLAALVDELKEATNRLERTAGSLKGDVHALRTEMKSVRDELAAARLKESQLRAIVRRDGELEDKEPALAAMMARGDIGAHVTAAFERSTLHLEPFPWMVIDGLLPDDLFDALVKGIPPAELFADKPANKQQIKVPFDLAHSYGRRVWRFMVNVVAPQHIMPVLVKTFEVPLAAWIRDNWPELGSDPLSASRVKLHTTDGRIFRHGRGYLIPPHRDPKWGFLTVLLYLARPGDSETWGTQIYSVDEDTEAKGSAPHWIDPAKCHLVQDVQYRPNRALIFLNSVGAHGASIPPDAQPEDLERYMYQFRVGPNTKSVRAMMEALPEERKALWAGKVAADY